MNGSVAPDELLARYIFFSGWIRKSDGKIKQDAFMPPDPKLPLARHELSVTRRLQLSEQNIWQIGKRIASGMNPPKTFYGRADVETRYVIAQGLAVVPDPVEPDNPDHPNHNPNHANIVNWPTDKDGRKMRALQIAEAAHFVANSEE